MFSKQRMAGLLATITQTQVFHSARFLHSTSDDGRYWYVQSVEAVHSSHVSLYYVPQLVMCELKGEGQKQ